MAFLMGTNPISISYFFPRPKTLNPIHVSSMTPKSENPILRTIHKTISSSIIAKADLHLQKINPNPPPIVEIMDDRSLSEILNSCETLSGTLREVIYTNLEAAYDDDEALSIVKDLVSNDPSETEWRFLAAQLLSENKKFTEAKIIYEEILESEPFSLDALYELAIVMNKLKEGEKVQDFLQKALDLAKSENRDKDVREIRIIMAQILLSQKKLEDSFKIFEELETEDSEDCRIYIAQGVIYTLMNKEKEAKEKFEKMNEISGGEFSAETVLQNGIRRIRVSERDDPEEMNLTFTN